MVIQLTEIVDSNHNYVPNDPLNYVLKNLIVGDRLLSTILPIPTISFDFTQYEKLCSKVQQL